MIQLEICWDRKTKRQKGRKIRGRKDDEKDLEDIQKTSRTPPSNELIRSKKGGGAVSSRYFDLLNLVIYHRCYNHP